MNFKKELKSVSQDKQFYMITNFQVTNVNNISTKHRHTNIFSHINFVTSFDLLRGRISKTAEIRVTLFVLKSINIKFQAKIYNRNIFPYTISYHFLPP